MKIDPFLSAMLYGLVRISTTEYSVKKYRDAKHFQKYSFKLNNFPKIFCICYIVDMGNPDLAYFKTKPASVVSLF